MITLYNVVSSDGFIAREDGQEDFIPDELWVRSLSIMEKYDAIVMGRNTYEDIQSYDRKLLEPFEKLHIKKIVVSKNPDFKTKDGYLMMNSLDNALVENNILVSSGPTLNESLISKKLVSKVILHIIPVTIGKGIRPFNLDFEELLVVQSEEYILNGVKEVEYSIN